MFARVAVRLPVLEALDGESADSVRAWVLFAACAPESDGYQFPSD